MPNRRRDVVLPCRCWRFVCLCEPNSMRVRTLAHLPGEMQLAACDVDKRTPCCVFPSFHFSFLLFLLFISFSLPVFLLFLLPSALPRCIHRRRSTTRVTAWWSGNSWRGGSTLTRSTTSSAGLRTGSPWRTLALRRFVFLFLLLLGKRYLLSRPPPPSAFGLSLPPPPFLFSWPRTARLLVILAVRLPRTCLRSSWLSEGRRFLIAPSHPLPQTLLFRSCLRISLIFPLN